MEYTALRAGVPMGNLGDASAWESAPCKLQAFRSTMAVSALLSSVEGMGRV